MSKHIKEAWTYSLKELDTLESYAAYRGEENIDGILNTMYENFISAHNNEPYIVNRDKDKTFHDNFTPYFNDYSNQDIKLLMRAFYYYRNKDYNIKESPQKNNPDRALKPYLKAIELLKSLYSEKDCPQDEDMLSEAFETIEREARHQTKTKNEMRAESNKKIDNLLGQLSNYSKSKTTIIKQFHILSNIL